MGVKNHKSLLFNMRTSVLPGAESKPRGLPLFILQNQIQVQFFFVRLKFPKAIIFCHNSYTSRAVGTNVCNDPCPVIHS